MGAVLIARNGSLIMKSEDLNIPPHPNKIYLRTLNRYKSRQYQVDIFKTGPSNYGEGDEKLLVDFLPQGVAEMPRAILCHAIEKFEKNKRKSSLLRGPSRKEKDVLKIDFTHQVGILMDK